MSNCKIFIKYKVGGQEYEIPVQTNFTEDTNLNPSMILEAFSGLSTEDLLDIKSKLSQLNPMSISIEYSNGEPLLGNFDLQTISEQVDYIQNDELKEDFNNLRNKLENLGVPNNQVQILLLEGENINLNIDGTTGIRGTLLKNNFIILNTKEGFNEDTLRDLYHEMLHLYFNNIPKSNENFSRISEIAYNVFETARKNKESNPVIKDFVNKVTGDKGYLNLTEFISYILADPKYREVLNFDLNEGVGREFTTRLFNIDSNIGIIADRINLDNVSAEKVWDGKEPVYVYGGDKITEFDPKEVYWSSVDNRFEVPPFVGKYDSEYIDQIIPKEISSNYEKVSDFIWKNYIETSSELNEKVSKYKYDLNYSEPVKLESSLQLYSLSPGDLILIPNISKSKGEVLFGKFDDKYFSSKQYLPIRSIWKNDKGETLITVLKQFGNKGINPVTISYTDLINLLSEKNLDPTFRKFYGKLDRETIDAEIIKSIKDQFDEGLNSGDYDNQPLLRELGIATRTGKEFTYYNTGKGGFRLKTKEGSNNLINQELRRGDIIKVSTPIKKGDKWERFEYFAPVLRTFGTVVEVALKSAEGKYFSKLYKFNDVQEAIFNKQNHPELVRIHNEFTSDYNKYLESTKNRSLYQSVWFSLPGLKEDSESPRQLNGDFVGAADTRAVVDFRRSKVKQLKIGDSVAVQWFGTTNSGRPIISKHMVIGIDGDHIYFLNKNRAGEGVATSRVSMVDLKTVEPNVLFDQGINRPIPSLVALYYNNTEDAELVEHLNTQKSQINNAFELIDGKWVFNGDSNTATSLNDLYDIINTDESNIVEEAAKLQRGDIIKYEENGRQYVGIVSRTDILNNIIEVPGYYRPDGSTDMFRKNISLDQIIYVGFAANPIYELGISGHSDIREYNSKRVSRLYDMNHSTYALSYDDALSKSNMFNKSTNWTQVTEVKYIAPKDSSLEFREKFRDSKEKGVEKGRAVIISDSISKLIKSGDYIDLTEEYIKQNKINSKDGKLYGLRKTIYSNGTQYNIQLPNATGFNYVNKVTQIDPIKIPEILDVQDVVKIQYDSNNRKKTTKYLRILSKTDKGIKLESEILGLDGKTYSNKWNINFNDLKSGKYKIVELYYPINKSKTDRINNILSDKQFTPKESSYFIQTIDRFNQKKILNRIISNINNTYNNIINVIDDATIKDWIANKNPDITPYIATKLKQSSAFILGNKVYVNTDKASLSSPLHELMHIVMGVMKQTTPERYNLLIDKASELPGFTERYRKVMQNRVLSDAKEEAFVDAVAKSLQGIFSSDNFNINNLLQSNNFFNDYLNILSNGLDLNIAEVGNKSAEVLSKELSNMPLEKIVMEFNSLLAQSANPKYSLFNADNLNKAFLHRTINNIKSSLLNSGNLIEKC